MLQQTQIETVIPYYERFIQEFPTIKHLAMAPLERVLELWSGLGYYRRARNLHGAAQVLAENNGGQFPVDLKQALQLPGVGDYTARAVLSIAYNQPFAVLDGNVARVMARFLALRGSISQSDFRRTIEENLESLLSRRSPGSFNQALMELGQIICLPHSPRCSLCPLKRWCRAFQLSATQDYPEPRPRRQAEKWYVATVVLYKGGRVLLCRGLDDGLLGDLWNFPAAMARSSSEALAQLEKNLRAVMKTVPDLKEPKQQLRHNITYRAIQVGVYAAEICGKVHKNDFRWFRAEAIEKAAISQLARKIVRKLGTTGLDM